MNLTDKKGKIKFYYIFFLVRNIVVFYWLNRLNRLKNQVLCGVAVVANRLNTVAVAVKSVKSGGIVGFLIFACVFLSSFYPWDALPGLLRIGAGSMVDVFPGWDKSQWHHI